MAVQKGRMLMRRYSVYSEDNEKNDNRDEIIQDLFDKIFGGDSEMKLDKDEFLERLA